MQTSASSPRSDGDARLEAALKDLGFAIKSLQLYPPTSPVVRQAVERSSASLVELLDGGRLSLEVTPRLLRRGNTEVGAGNPLVQQLARRLHGHGFARVHFDPRLDAASLQRLAEMVAADRGEYDERGGLDVVFGEERPPGIHAEFLELDRLFDETAEEEVEDIWDALLEGFAEEAEIENVDWASLANNVERLQDFVAWVATNVDDIAERTGYESIDVYKFVVEQIGGIAAALGSEHVNFLVLAVRRAFEQIDKETLVDLLADPYEVEVRGESGDSSASMTLGDFLGGAGASGDRSVMPEERSTVDITRFIASGLDLEQAQELILHTIRTRGESSARLYGLFSRLMEGRQDRLALARRVRGLLEQEIFETEGDSSLLDNWPRLVDALEGEAPERFVSTEYNQALQALLADDSLRGVWDVDRIRPRLTEMKPSFVVQRKALVLADVLEVEDDDERFGVIVRELGKALHEAALHDHYFLVSSLLVSLQGLVDDEARSTAQRDAAGEVLEGFYQPDVLREMLRKALAGTGREVDAIVKIVRRRADEVVPVLLDTLADEDTRRVRQRLLQILTALGDSAIDGVLDRLDDERWYFLRNLLLLLGEGGGEEQVVRIIPLTRHADARVRSQAIDTIVRLGGPTVPEALVAATEDPDEGTRISAVHGLGFHSSPRGVERLRALLALGNLRGQNSAVIKTAAIALGRLKDEQSRARLTALARKPWFFARQRQPVTEGARWALGALDNQRPGTPPEAASLRQLRPGKRARKRRLR
ncbi:MAG: HEAT repeat domain-containing protein [Acidobacteriota bacterium]|jgi:HEAT repeat protein